VIEVCGHDLHSVPPPPSQRTERPIPADLEQLIMRCLQKSAADRVSDARAFREALRSCLDAGWWSESEAREWFALQASALRGRTPPG
jgi:serine/threonine-protein kinase